MRQIHEQLKYFEIIIDPRLNSKMMSSPRFILLRGKGGVPWVQIMENEFEYLADRGDHGGHLAEKFLKKYCS